MDKELRRRAEASLRELGVQGPVSNDALQALLEARTGRPIVVQTAPASLFRNAVCSGAWWESAQLDVILVPEGEDEMLRAHTIRHELAHMILRHQGATSGPRAMVEMLQQMMPDLDADKVVGMLRADFSNEAERDAEMIASLLTLRSALAGAELRNAETESLRRALGGGPSV